jgi:hypothetical protein
VVTNVIRYIYVYVCIYMYIMYMWCIYTHTTSDRFMLLVDTLKINTKHI